MENETIHSSCLFFYVHCTIKRLAQVEIIIPQKFLVNTSYLLIVHCTIKSSAEYSVEQCSMF